MSTKARKARVERKTRETEIALTLNLLQEPGNIQEPKP